MRKHLLLVLVIMAVLCAGCATTQKPSGPDDRGTPRSGPSGY